MKKFIVIAALLCGLFLSSYGQERVLKNVELNNKTTLTGYVKTQQDGSIVLETEAGDLLYLGKSEVRSIKTAPGQMKSDTNDSWYDGLVVYKKKSNLYYYSDNRKLEKQDFVNYQQWSDFEKARTIRSLGIIMICAGTGLGVIGFSADAAGVAQESGAFYVAGLVGLGSLAAGSIITIIGNSKIKKIADSFNSSSHYSTSFGLQKHGVGFALTF